MPMLKPLLKQWDHERQAWTWGLNPDDFKKVQAGYACSRCLEDFTFWPEIPRECPVCKEPNVPAWAELPPDWEQFRWKG
jgi:hypothetical protein